MATNPDPNDIDPSSDGSKQKLRQVETGPDNIVRELSSADALEKARNQEARRAWLELPETQRFLKELELARNSQLINIENNSFNWPPISVAVAIEKARTYRAVVDMLRNNKTIQ